MKSKLAFSSVLAPAKLRPAIVLLVASLALAFAGCSSSMRHVTRAAGHDITADIEGAPTVEIVSAQGLIASSHGRVTIERARARIDGGDWVRIPEDVPVAVKMSRHKVSFAAGPVTVARTVR